MDTFILKLRLFLFTWLHIRSRPSSVYFVKCFSYKKIKKATDGFRRILDNSSNGAIYKAKFQNGQAAIIKQIRVFDDLDDDSFYRKVQLLGHLHHRHIVTLSGFSAGHKRFLVYEDFEKGSLKDHLSDPLKTPLNWRTRLQIAGGIAAALEYLHFFCDPPVFHVSISSSTIMLDENLIAKLSDVSLLSSAMSHKTTPSASKEDNGGVDLVQRVQECSLPRSINKLIDPDLGNSYNSRELKGLLAVARLCIESVDKPSSYPSQILRYLKTKVAPARTYNDD